jgi:hypothetical protein
LCSNQLIINANAFRSRYSCPDKKGRRKEAKEGRQGKGSERGGNFDYGWSRVSARGTSIWREDNPAVECRVVPTLFNTKPCPKKPFIVFPAGEIAMNLTRHFFFSFCFPDF